MKCWSCDCDNLEGVDACARCGEDLTTPAYDRFADPIERDLLHHRLGELVVPGCIEVPSTAGVGEVVRRIHEDGKQCALVVDNGRLVGILSERDVLLKTADRWQACADQPVRDFMTPNPETLADDAPVAFALNRMMVGGYRHVPILHEGRTAGVLSVRDILGYLVQLLSDTIGGPAPE